MSLGSVSKLAISDEIEHIPMYLVSPDWLVTSEHIISERLSSCSSSSSSTVTADSRRELSFSLAVSLSLLRSGESVVL